MNVSLGDGGCFHQKESLRLVVWVWWTQRQDFLVQGQQSAMAMLESPQTSGQMAGTAVLSAVWALSVKQAGVW